MVELAIVAALEQLLQGIQHVLHASVQKACCNISHAAAQML